MKRTRQREAVIAVLKGAGAPISAQDILAQAGKGGAPIWLSTVYRILETLVGRGAASKITVMDGSMALYDLNRPAHRHYAICVGCRKIVSMDNCPMDAFVPKLADSDFRVTGHNVEVYGYCKSCDSGR
jgi:Fur family ferric uptake transcriptional regulator